MSMTDDGNQFYKGECLVGQGTLDTIGQISPNNWYWTPKAYYDNNEPLRNWAKWPKNELISYSELRQRIITAAQLNNQHQEIVEWGHNLAAERDADNCFRVVELGIPEGEEVTVLASPRIIEGSDRKITFVSPDYTRTEEDKLGREFFDLLEEKGGRGMKNLPVKGLIKDERTNTDLALPRENVNTLMDEMMPRFRFRILQGHTIANLRKHRRLSMLVYAGLGAMGLYTAQKGARYLK